MSAPTLINLPPPPSDPVTPSDLPGTPNSTTTSMSELSTVAIKDGFRGHPHHHSHHRQHPSVSDNANALDAERADRISRLAGLERVGTVRQSSNASLPAGASASHPQGYFDGQVPPSNLGKERSTVGSASATGSVGGRTTWASGSDAYDNTDKMSEDQDMDTSSAGGFSDEGNASLVGFGEGASSTVSGPISTGAGIRTPQRQSGIAGLSKSSVPPYIRDTPTAASPVGGIRDVRMTDEMTTDSRDTLRSGHPSIATAHQRQQPSQTGAETAEQIMGGTFDSTPGGMNQEEAKSLGSFPFEERK